MGGGNISKNKTIFVLVSLLLFMIAIGSAAAADTNQTVTNEDMGFDYTQENSDIVSVDDADSSADISQNENKNLTDEKDIKASMGEVLSASNDEDNLGDSDYLKIRDSSGNAGTINVKTEQSVTVEWW